ncbi:hypothetical protein TKK_0010776 [Trichogramma kaykai]
MPTSLEMSPAWEDRVITMLGHIETALAGVRVACAESTTGAVATGEKLDRAMATPRSNSERIDAIQVRQGQIEHYLRRARSCTELKIMGITSAVVSSPGTDIHQLSRCLNSLERTTPLTTSRRFAGSTHLLLEELLVLLDRLSLQLGPWSYSINRL